MTVIQQTTRQARAMGKDRVRVLEMAYLSEDGAEIFSGEKRAWVSFSRRGLLERDLLSYNEQTSCERG